MKNFLDLIWTPKREASCPKFFLSVPPDNTAYFFRFNLIFFFTKINSFIIEIQKKNASMQRNFLNLNGQLITRKFLNFLPKTNVLVVNIHPSIQG